MRKPIARYMIISTMDTLPAEITSSLTLGAGEKASGTTD
jgi:ribonuclease HIII